MLGRPVAEALKGAGFDVRVLARSVNRSRAALGEGYDIVPGDFEDETSLRAGLRGCQGVHINIKGGPSAADFDRVDHLGTERIARAAVAESVARVTLISAYAVSPEAADTPESRSKLQGEAALKATGSALHDLPVQLVHGIAAAVHPRSEDEPDRRPGPPTALDSRP